MSKVTSPIDPTDDEELPLWLRVLFAVSCTAFFVFSLLAVAASSGALAPAPTEKSHAAALTVETASTVAPASPPAETKTETSAPAVEPAPGVVGAATDAIKTLADSKSREDLEEEWAAADRLNNAGCAIVRPERGLHITAVKIQGERVCDADLADLRKLPHVERLIARAEGHPALKRDQLSNAAIAHIATLRQLVMLDLSGLNVDDAACRDIARLPNLRGLSVANTLVSDDGLAELKKLPKLEVLDLSGTSVSGAGLAHLAEARGLQWLDLRGVRLTTADLKAVGRLTSLKELFLPAVALAPNAHANPVYYRYEPEGDRAPGYPPLPSNRLDYAAGVSHLAGLVKLKSPAMTGVFREAGEQREGPNGYEWDFQPLTERGNMASFLVRPSGDLVRHIARYENVTSLDLSHLLVTDEDLKLLSGFSKLERLDLSGQYITAAGLEHVQKLPLKYLNLRGCAVGDADLHVLESIKTLKTVILSQTRVTPEAAEAFTRGPRRVVYQPDQPRPAWCNTDWTLKASR